MGGRGLTIDKSDKSVHKNDMPSDLKSRTWLTATSLFQIQILSCDLVDFVKWDSPDHCAPFWRLYWHNRSGGELVFKGETRSVRPNQVILIPPNTHFGSRLRKPFTQFFLHFRVEPAIVAHESQAFHLKGSPVQLSLCRRICRELQRDATSHRSALWSQMLVADALSMLPKELWTERFEDARITRAVGAIREAYPRRLPNPTLAREAGLHAASFLRLFARHTGHTPRAYLMHLRMEEACSLLHHDEASLDEIAERTGFCDRSYFTRVFTRRMNCSPAHYRRLVNVSERKRPSG